MKAVVFAYHDMGCTGLNALINAGFEITAVFTHADSPNENHFHGSVAQTAQDKGIPVFMPEDINQPACLEQLGALAPDAIFCFSYRQVLSQQILSCARFGAFNVHASLLPAYRGRAHLNWVLIKGETETGVTLHRMTSRPDSGPILAQQAVSITAEDDAFSLHTKLVATAGEKLASWLPALREGKLIEQRQDEAKASCFGRRKPEDGQINWAESAENIHNLIRALASPWPGAFSEANGKRYIVWKSRFSREPHTDAPGTILSTDPLVVACAAGTLEIVTGQCEEGVKLSGAELGRRMGMAKGQISVK